MIDINDIKPGDEIVLRVPPESFSDRNPRYLRIVDSRKSDNYFLAINLVRNTQGWWAGKWLRYASRMTKEDRAQLALDILRAC